MEKIISGAEINNRVSFSASNPFSLFCGAIQKGHHECGDSAFAYWDNEKVILGIFDGVSGEEGASTASSTAANFILTYLKKEKTIGVETIKSAIFAAHKKIQEGFTTAVVLVVNKDGSFILASVGDSPAYYFPIEDKRTASLQLPLGRVVNEKESVDLFFSLRNIVTSCLGGGQSSDKLIINSRTAKFTRGDFLILASDGLSDNLFISVKDEKVKDFSGVLDLKSLIGKEKIPSNILNNLLREISKRMGTTGAGPGTNQRTSYDDKILLPKEDDLSIIVFKFK